MERRQRLVLNTAAKSSAVVNSMFPEAVRDRLLNDDDEKEKKRAKGVHFMNTGMNPGGADKSSAPIADFYPDTTILFADLVGFTVSLMVAANGVWALHHTTASISLTFPPFSFFAGLV